MYYHDVKKSLMKYRVNDSNYTAERIPSNRSSQKEFFNLLLTWFIRTYIEAASSP
jgi:hypothetical protein